MTEQARVHTPTGEIGKAPTVRVPGEGWRDVLCGVGPRVADTAGYAVSVIHMNWSLKSGRPATSGETIAAMCLAATIARGGPTDRVGWRHLWGAVRRSPGDSDVPAGQASLTAIMIIVGIFRAVCQNALAGAQAAWFPDPRQAPPLRRCVADLVGYWR